jgi:hypothetical protein
VFDCCTSLIPDFAGKFFESKTEFFSGDLNSPRAAQCPPTPGSLV